MSKGKIIIVSCIIIFLGMVSFLVYQVNYKKSKYLYLFTGDTEMVRWYYNDDTWHIANNNKKLNEKFDVYYNGNYIGAYNLVYNNRWYFFDNNNKSTNVVGDFMINTNYEFTSFKFQENSINDQKIIDKLKNRFTSDGKEYEIDLKEITIDNENLGKIYVVSFKEISDEYEVMGPSYSAVFTYFNNKITFLKELDFSNNNNNNTNKCYLDLEGVFTFENKNIKIFLSCQHYDNIPSDYYMLEKKWNKYEVIVDTLGGEK